MATNIVRIRQAAVVQARTSRRTGLTELNVKSRGRAGQTIWDDDIKGLGVRITTNGARTFVWTRMLDGRNIRIALDAVGAITLREARTIAEGYNAAWARGEDPRVALETARESRRKAEDKGPTLEAAYEAYVNRLRAKGGRPSTLKDYSNLWRHVEEKLRKTPIKEITIDTLQKAVDTVAADTKGTVRKDGSVAVRKAGKATTARKLAVLFAAVLKVAGLGLNNPAKEVAVARPNVRTTRLRADEVHRLLAVLNARKGEVFADFILVALTTGARRGALEAMRWENIDLDAAIWTVPADWSKNHKELAVALPARAVEVLRARKAITEKSPWVWPSWKSKTGHIVNAEKPLAAFRSEAGVGKVSLHDLRRTLGSRLAISGANAATISKALGHLSPQSAKAYVHLDLEPVRDAMEKLFDAPQK